MTNQYPDAYREEIAELTDAARELSAALGQVHGEANWLRTRIENLHRDFHQGRPEPRRVPPRPNLQPVAARWEPNLLEREGAHGTHLDGENVRPA